LGIDEAKEATEAPSSTHGGSSSGARLYVIPGDRQVILATRERKRSSLG
jgi:hypothetical protein